MYLSSGIIGTTVVCVCFYGPRLCFGGCCLLIVLIFRGLFWLCALDKQQSTSFTDQLKRVGKMKYVLVTGGVVSGLGKGVTASSIGLILKACGLRVTSIKIGIFLVLILLWIQSSLPFFLIREENAVCVFLLSISLIGLLNGQLVWFLGLLEVLFGWKWFVEEKGGLCFLVYKVTDLLFFFSCFWRTLDSPALCFFLLSVFFFCIFKESKFNLVQCFSSLL